MILTLDIGNQRIKWGCWEAGAFSATGAWVWREAALEDALQPLLAQRPRRVLVSNVAGPQPAAAIDAFFAARAGLRPEYLRARRACAGVRNAYTDPATLGNDRWAALLGLHALGLGDACVVDCGTAVTIDVLDARGQHRGGAITAGLVTMRQALGRATHNLRASTAPPELLAADTASGIQGGTLYAVAGAIDKMIAEAEAQTGLTLQGVITGGDAEPVCPHLARALELKPHLVLQGLLVGLGA